VKIELAQPEDTIAVFDMFSSYNGEDLERLGMKFSRETLMENVQKMIGAGMVMVARDKDNMTFGAVAGFITNCDFSDELIFNAKLFYVHPDWRGKTILLINRLIDLLKTGLADHLVISSPAWSGEPMNRFYHIQGFKKLESHFIKKIERVAA
jgi:GNAT superfamily N-acetyltransferase